MVLFEEGGGPHRAITGLTINTGYLPIQQILSIQDLLLFSNHDRHIWRWYETSEDQFSQIRNACGIRQTMENETR